MWSMCLLVEGRDESQCQTSATPHRVPKKRSSATNLLFVVSSVVSSATFVVSSVVSSATSYRLLRFTSTITPNTMSTTTFTSML